MYPLFDIVEIAILPCGHRHIAELYKSCVYLFFLFIPSSQVIILLDLASPLSIENKILFGDRFCRDHWKGAFQAPKQFAHYHLSLKFLPTRKAFPDDVRPSKKAERFKKTLGFPFQCVLRLPFFACKWL